MIIRLLLIAAGAVLVLSACSADDEASTGTTADSVASFDGGQQEEQPGALGEGRPLVFVTDFGLGLEGGWRSGPSDVDDAMAVALAVASERFEILGLVTTFGNTITPPQASVAAPGFFDAAGWSLPVVEGSTRPLARPLVTYDDDPITDTCLTPGIEAFGDLIEGRADVVVAGIAPLTPLACLALNRPESLDGVTDVVVLMGVEPDTDLAINGVAVTDFNFGVDVGAAQVVFDQTELPITLLTFESSSVSTMTATQIDDLAESGSDLGTYFSTQSQPWVESWTSTFSEDGIHPWDANTIWWLLEPSAYQCRETGYTIDIPADDDPGSAIDDADPHLYVADTYDSRPVTACTAYADSAAETGFVDAVLSALG